MGRTCSDLTLQMRFVLGYSLFFLVGEDIVFWEGLEMLLEGMVL